MNIKRQEGQGLVGYAILLILIALIVIGLWSFIQADSNNNGIPDRKEAIEYCVSQYYPNCEPLED